MTMQIKPQTLIDQILRFAAPTLFGMPERMANGLMIVICASIAFLVMGKLVITTQAYSSIMNVIGILYLTAAAFLIMGSLPFRKEYENLMTDHVRADIYDGEHLVHQMAGIDIATIDIGILKSRYFWILGLKSVPEQLAVAMRNPARWRGFLFQGSKEVSGSGAGAGFKSNCRSISSMANSRLGNRLAGSSSR